MNNPYVVDLWVEHESPGKGRCRKTVSDSDWTYVEAEPIEGCDAELKDLLQEIDRVVQERRRSS